MGPSSKKSHKILLLILTIYSLSSQTTSLAASKDITTLVFKGCANQKFQDPSGISSQNLQTLYNTLISQSSSNTFYNTTTGNDQLTATSLTGLYQCRGDLSNSDCNKCIKKVPDTIQKVCGGNTIAARIQLDGCYLKYEVVGFPPASSTDLLFKQCGTNRASGSGFDQRLESALEQIQKGVGNDKGFYSGVYQSVYVLGQCEGDLGNDDCGNCIKSAGENAKSVCGSSLSAQIYLEKCYISYTYYPNGVPGSGTGGGGGGIQTGETETGGGGGRHSTQKTVAIIIGGLAGLFLGIAFLLVLKSAFKKKKEKHSHYGGY
uniref:plasmodesmata-located protein 3-like n=1 Tax=Erigeron canadensis TaxID=72917 RepID=UPI001CB9D095|nr:plasmodesmata-located protein 3-like [Erigeron canadensis]